MNQVNRVVVANYGGSVPLSKPSSAITARASKASHSSNVCSSKPVSDSDNRPSKLVVMLFQVILLVVATFIQVKPLVLVMFV